MQVRNVVVHHDMAGRVLKKESETPKFSSSLHLSFLCDLGPVNLPFGSLRFLLGKMKVMTYGGGGGGGKDACLGWGQVTYIREVGWVGNQEEGQVHALLLPAPGTCHLWE